MASTRGRCTNFDYCGLADRRAEIDVPLGENFMCPECGKALRPPAAPQGGGLRAATLAGVALAVIGGGAAAYLYMRSTAVTVAVQTPARPAALSMAPKPLQMTIPAQLTKEAAIAAKPAAAVPETILLRLSGSNTVGAVLGPKLAQAFLTETGDANVELVPGPAADETRIIGQRGDKRDVITVSAHGSATAFTDMARGAADVGMASRRITPAEAKALEAAGDMMDASHEHVLALDGIAVIVNPANQVATLTTGQLRDIFSGTATDWSQVGGAPGKIHVLARDDKSGTFDTFKALVLGTSKITPAARRIEDSRQLSAEISADAGAIGFIGLPYVLAARAVPVADTGATALLANRLTVGTEDYPLARRLFLYTTGAGDNALAPRFTEFALSAAGQAIAEQAGFVALTVKPEVAAVPPAAPDRLKQLIGHATRLSTNFRFQPNSTSLDNRGQRDLDRLVNFVVSVHATPGQIILIGFADNQGKAGSSLMISRKRAEAVAAGLAQRGLPVKQVAAFGADLPVADNGTEEGREKNRRVEVYVAL